MMTSPVIVAFGTALLASVVLFFEWRRKNRRGLYCRMAAALIAIGAMLRLLPERFRQSAGSERILLYTPALDPLPETPVFPGELVFALPDSSGPRDALVIPDLGYLLRHYPGLRELRVAGDGIQNLDTPIPASVAVTLANARSVPSQPKVAAVDFSPQINLGDSLTVRGRIEGLREPVKVSLADPGGESSSISVEPANGVDGSFVIRSAPAKAVGNFQWQLRISALGPAEKIWELEEIGVAVRTPRLPRVLVLESSPHLDTARLRDWYGKIGGKLVSRTQVSRDRYRFAVSAGPPMSFAQIGERELAATDILVLDENARLSLATNEIAALGVALRDGKIGVLVTGPPEKSLGPQPGTDGLFPEWKLSLVDAEGGGIDRRVRLSTQNGPAPPEPVSVENFQIQRNVGDDALLQDGQDRVLVATALRGEGRVARSLVRDTWQWQRGDAADSFAHYWLWLFGVIAPSDPAPDCSIGDLLPTVNSPTSIFGRERLLPPQRFFLVPPRWRMTLAA